MNQYRVRAQHLGALGYFTQADHYRDYDMESSESLEELAGRLAAKGFQDPDGRRWIMPGAIVSIEQK